jgi:hypothetical protein
MYSASDVNVYNTTSNPVGFENKYIFYSTLKKTLWHTMYNVGVVLAQGINVMITIFGEIIGDCSA